MLRFCMHMCVDNTVLNTYQVTGKWGGALSLVLALTYVLKTFFAV